MTSYELGRPSSRVDRLFSNGSGATPRDSSTAPGDAASPKALNVMSGSLLQFFEGRRDRANVRIVECDLDRVALVVFVVFAVFLLLFVLV